MAWDAGVQEVQRANVPSDDPWGDVDLTVIQAPDAGGSAGPGPSGAVDLTLAVAQAVSGGIDDVDVVSTNGYLSEIIGRCGGGSCCSSNCHKKLLARRLRAKVATVRAHYLKARCDQRAKLVLT